MAHLLKFPATGAYWVPVQGETFTVDSLDGEGELLAHGVGSRWESEFTVSLASGVNDRIVCKAYRGPTPDLVFYRLRNLRAGDVLVLYRNIKYDGGVTNETEWVKHSTQSVKVTFVSAEFRSQLNQGLQGLPFHQTAKGKKIFLSGYGAQQRDIPMAEDKWVEQTRAVIEQISKNSLGQKIIDLLADGITIYADAGTRLNANSSVLFTAENFKDSTSQHGGAPDEVLLHEFVHRCEGNRPKYLNVTGWEFSETDFLSVNATNVYSCLLRRGLRKDHAGFEPLPNEYFTDPQSHFTLFRQNYALAWQQSRPLCEVLRDSSPLWNQFKYR